jgi:hypothetical protein
MNFFLDAQLISAMSHSSYMTDKLAHIIVSRLLMQKKIDTILQAIIDRGSMNPDDDKALASREYQLSQLELEYRLLTGRSFTDISNEEIEAAEALLERCSAWDVPTVFPDPTVGAYRQVSTIYLPVRVVLSPVMFVDDPGTDPGDWRTSEES